MSGCGDALRAVLMVACGWATTCVIGRLGEPTKRLQRMLEGAVWWGNRLLQRRGACPSRGHSTRLELACAGGTTGRNLEELAEQLAKLAEYLRGDTSGGSWAHGVHNWSAAEDGEQEAGEAGQERVRAARRMEKPLVVRTAEEPSTTGTNTTRRARTPISTPPAVLMTSSQHGRRLGEVVEWPCRGGGSTQERACVMSAGAGFEGLMILSVLISRHARHVTLTISRHARHVTLRTSQPPGTAGWLCCLLTLHGALKQTCRVLQHTGTQALTGQHIGQDNT
jgi:hypothetical protein